MALSTIRVRVHVKWGQLSPGLRPAMQSLRNEVLDTLKDDIERHAPSRVRVRRTALADVVVEGPAAPIEFGTKPGYFPNVTNLWLTWGSKIGKTWQEMWAVATHISRHGTPPRPFVFPALDRLNLDYILTKQWLRFFSIRLRR